MWQNEIRVEELDSDDTDTQGVGLNSEKRFHSDPLHFTGIDMSSASSRARRGYNYGSEESSSDSEISEFEGTNALQVALRDKEEALVQSALARIRRAQEKGKREVKLNQDELDALEKRRKRMQAAATTKSRRGSGESGGSGSERRRHSEKHLITVPIGEPSSRKKSKSKRSSGVSPHPPAASNPPGMLVAGADGLQFAPVGYYPQANSSPNRNSLNRPRSVSSAQHLRGGPPPYPADSSNRHFSDTMRPSSSSSTSSRRPLPDEEGWMPEHSRRSSISSQPLDPFEYQTSSSHPPPIPQQYIQQSNRRIVSGPPEIAYSSVRRSPPTGYPAAARAPVSDPQLRRKSSRREELSQSSSEDEDEDDESDDLGNGVKVFVEEKQKEKPVVPRKPVGGSSNRRKGKR